MEEIIQVRIELSLSVAVLCTVLYFRGKIHYSAEQQLK